MFLYQELTPAQAQAHFEDYVGGLDDRFKLFVAHIGRVNGPIDAVATGRSGLEPVWSWFLDTYIDQRATPLSDAGTSVVRYPWFDTPRFDLLGDEGTTIASGIASWMIRLMAETLGRPIPWRLEPPKGVNHPNEPVVNSALGIRPDVMIASAGGQILRGTNTRPRAADYLLTKLIQWETDTFFDTGDARLVVETDARLVDPEIVFDSDLLEHFEVEIDLDPRVDWARRKRFAGLLAADPQLRGFTDADEREALIVTRHGNDDKEFAAMVQRLWLDSE